MSIKNLHDDDFYNRCPSFRRFKDFSKAQSYFEVPRGWWVITADIRGSTKAIQENRYQDVNMSGAATIAAVLNVAGNTEVPFVFGGDGATFLIPHSLMPKAKESLLRTQAFIQNIYNLEMRVGAVPVEVIVQTGAKIEVAKFELSPGNTIAFIRGGGLTISEGYVKNGGPNGESYLLTTDGEVALPDLAGLSCRWDPIDSKKGVVLSLLISARDVSNADKVYEMIMAGLSEHLDLETHDSAPVGEKNFKPGWPPHSWRFENALLDRSHGIIANVINFLKYNLTNLVVHLALIFKFKVGAFEPEKYIRELELNSDFRKFDDMLRMVVDCSEIQYNRVEGFLQLQHHRGLIFYGLHKSKKAMMTCLVKSHAAGQHIHFIDGAGGGYALAATRLKAQMAGN